MNTRPPSGYRGRFAPSPTGALHQGSLLAAVASWLDARSHGGTWLIRMEDLDRPREVPGAAQDILATLARLGLESDEPVLYQSTRTEAYAAALRRLASSGLAYRCRCPRSELHGPYDGRCRDLGITDPDSAWRLRLEPGAVLAFEDRLQGHCEFTAASLGDPVLVRRDGLAAYQLAVVVDDAFQGITDVVRGADLLESTAWQIALARALGLPIPSYAHVPLLTEPNGEKLSKSRRSLSIATIDPAVALTGALAALGCPQPQLDTAVGSDILLCAVQHWPPQGGGGRSRPTIGEVENNLREVKDERPKSDQEVSEPSPLRHGGEPLHHARRHPSTGGGADRIPRDRQEDAD